MNYANLLWSLDLPGLVFIVYWLVKGAKTRETQRKEPFTSRYGVMLILIVGYVCIFSSRASIGILGRRFVPTTTDVALFGVIVTWLGIALAIWARHDLGEFWSARVTIKEGHELIRTGPYARFRHPIYSGLFLATLGSAVAIGEWRCLLGVALVLMAYSIKAKREEAMLTEQFREAFAEHRRHTGFLLPKLR
jgi:protein-S-isoprenylcysteine O-methyltransferase Ste14